MKFNYSEKATHMVSLYGWNVHDQIYFEDRERAWEKYMEICERDYAGGDVGCFL